MMNKVIKSIFEEIKNRREDGYQVNQIKIDHQKKRELLKCDSIIKAQSHTTTDTTRVAGVDVAVDGSVDGIEIEDNSMKFVDIDSCVFCGADMMYDEKKQEHYCPICEK